MAFVVGLLTFVLILDCVLVVLLVLIQLPKKEAGVGVAFGGAATDALFGAGSGNVLTKATKYMAGSFFVLAIILSILHTHLFHRNQSEFERELLQTQQQPATPHQRGLPAPASAPSTIPFTNPAAASTSTGMNLLTPSETLTNPLSPPAAPGATVPNANATNPAPATPSQ